MKIQRFFQGAMFLALLMVLVACGNMPPAASSDPSPTQDPTALQADLSGVKTYLLTKANTLKTNTAKLQESSNRYYDLAQAADFDYAALWAGRSAEVKAIIEEARAIWVAASPGYEQIEGIVAGVPSLAEYDVILDAGVSGREDSEGAAPFDLTLPDGRVLPKPGNLFGVTESALWGTEPEYVAPGVHADFNGDGQKDFAESLPEANVLKAGVDALDRYTAELLKAAEAWQPTESDAFTALVVMTPTMSEYFNSWKDSRFVLGGTSTQRDFVAISRLADIQDILSGLQVTYQGVAPLVAKAAPRHYTQIEQGLADLKTFVTDVYVQEKSGTRYSPEEADLLGAEAQNRGTAITGQITQVAAQLNIKLQD